jgi:hypothetical protein
MFLNCAEWSASTIPNFAHHAHLASPYRKINQQDKAAAILAEAFASRAGLFRTRLAVRARQDIEMRQAPELIEFNEKLLVVARSQQLG